MAGAPLLYSSIVASAELAHDVEEIPSLFAVQVEVSVFLLRGRQSPPYLRDSLVRVHSDGRAIQECDVRHRGDAEPDFQMAATHAFIVHMCMRMTLH